METSTSVGHMPGEKWAFDEAVTGCFDDMLARSIPQYAVMRDAVARIAARHARPDTAIVDLGCSRGEALAPLVERLGGRNRFIGVEVSEPMLAAARERFADHIRFGMVEILDMDLRNAFPECRASVVLSVLTLQFTPIEYRLEIVGRVFDALEPGGAFVLVEKVLGSGPGLNRLFVEEYLALKERNGYSREEIDRKRFSLEGVLVPVTAAWNEDMLRGCGFRSVDCFWRLLNFAGWIAVK
ncbi:MAG TPA: methyltransferase domain-containing protein [Verrucomicrobiae bacterium]|nr:methyltransferase domain-containing protein [Verrucomicrobiae bacterium]